MIYNFLTEKDLDVAMKKYFREQITEVTTQIHIQTTAEGAAFSLIKSKLNDRYDLTKLFPSIVEWASGTAFTVGQYCSKSDIIYKAILAGSNKDPVTQTTYWVKSDPRDQLLVVYCACITAYIMMKSVAPRKISDDHHNDYDTIIQWFDDVRAGLESPDWDLKEEGSSEIRWGSSEQTEHYY